MRWVRLGVALVAACLPVSVAATTAATSPSRALASAVEVEAEGTTVGPSSDGELLVWQVSGSGADLDLDVSCTVTDDAGGTLRGDLEPGPVLSLREEEFRRIGRYDVPPWIGSTTVDCTPDDAYLALTTGSVEPHPAHEMAAWWFGGCAAAGVALIGVGLVSRRREESSSTGPGPGATTHHRGSDVIPPAPGTERPRVRGLTFRPPGDDR